MKLIQEAVLLLATLFAISVIADAQDTYADCSTNFTVLENALFETSDNLFQLSATYFNPEYMNPIYVDVFYHFGDTNTSAHYKWSASSLYLIVPPHALQHLSLFFTYFEKGSIAKLHLQLPVDCVRLRNVTNFSKKNFLFVLTQRLRIYAKYYHSLDHIALQNDFEARVVSYGEQYERFETDSGTLVFFSFILTFPVIAFLFLVVFVGRQHSYIRDHILKKADHHPTQAALVCVGQCYTLYVAIMDVLAVTDRESEISPQLRGIVSFIAAVEFVLFIIVTVLVCILCCRCDYFRQQKGKVQLWFVVVGIIPAFVCLSSHIGFMIEGWISSNSLGTSVMLLYSCLFVIIFMTFQSVYSLVTPEESEQSQGQQHSNSNYTIQQDPEQQTLISTTQQSQKQRYLSFPTLAAELLIGIPILVAILAYIAFGIFEVPIIRGTENVATRVYDLGDTAQIFVVLLIAYIVFWYKQKEQPQK